MADHGTNTGKLCSKVLDLNPAAAGRQHLQSKISSAKCWPIVPHSDGELPDVQCAPCHLDVSWEWHGHGKPDLVKVLAHIQLLQMLHHRCML